MFFQFQCELFVIQLYYSCKIMVANLLMSIAFYSFTGIWTSNFARIMYICRRLRDIGSWAVNILIDIQLLLLSRFFFKLFMRPTIWSIDIAVGDTCISCDISNMPHCTIWGIHLSFKYRISWSLHNIIKLSIL